ncbi:3-deoxy-manno-octulosonate cytidylyltransferase [Silvanigrella paludirubra]|uniref:3-deoxy-manno-octulosonate cytidylyltransferase n=1 Tax=Silvanigrella paludirubra TaxID=2499159 RepID=A0A6N6VPE2_9BACT|nr:3-deoxy-manno-octulosonate cytidylyltransferase [Silvanigrella paludirubra]KAB8036816.1 3-deoxy-manno-octulosonate cytidylyltransferase [Silvanigrella paludirubra]
MHLCVIPARMNSSRFPGKPLYPIMGYPMIGHVAKRCILSNVFDQVYVATCDNEIVEFCKKNNIQVVMTSSKHERASDRVQEATNIIESENNLSFNYVTMVQGDEPLVTFEMLKLAVSSIISTNSNIVNLRSIIKDEDEFQSPNCVKVVCDKNENALYFSRSPIPSPAKCSGSISIKPYKQICVIPFERKFLDLYSALPVTELEEIESVDMLRVLENGYKIYCPQIDDESYPVDVLNDVIRVEFMLKKCELVKRYI